MLPDKINDKMNDTLGTPTISTPTGIVSLRFAQPKVHRRESEYTCVQKKTELFK
jgi:hypothetical protein